MGIYESFQELYDPLAPIQVVDLGKQIFLVEGITEASKARALSQVSIIIIINIVIIIVIIISVHNHHNDDDYCDNRPYAHELGRERYMASVRQEYQ